MTNLADGKVTLSNIGSNLADGKLKIKIAVIRRISINNLKPKFRLVTEQLKPSFRLETRNK